MQFIFRLISEVLSDELSLFFALIIVMLFIAAFFAGLAARFLSQDVHERLSRFVGYAPTAMTTVGVIGTFSGIFIGLLDFDVADIDASVPSLLAGLKIAFASSIVGMFGATLFRLLEHLGRLIFLTRPTVSNSNNPVSLLNDIKISIDKQTNALIGENEFSIATTLQRCRTDIQDGFRDQIKGFNEFAEKLKDGATEKIVDALKQAIEDFNTNITEQFGDNFKELNQAVGNLNTWQQEYKVQIERTQESLKKQSSELEHIVNNISSLVEQSKVMPLTAEKMMQASQESLNNFESMKDLLESLSKIKSDAEVVIPRIEQSMTEIARIMEESVNNVGETIKGTLAQTQQGINANFETFDEQMQMEISKVLENMGTNLTSLSNRFVEDYTPLTDKLRTLVQQLGSAAE